MTTSPTKINHELYIRILHAKEDFAHDHAERTLPKVYSVTTRDYNGYRLSQEEWYNHIHNVSKIKNRDNFKLDLRFDKAEEQKPRMPIGESVKKQLRELSYKIPHRKTLENQAA